MTRLYICLLVALLSACVPKAQTSIEKEIAMLEPRPLGTLLGSVLAVPLTDSRLPFDEPLSRGEPLAFSGGTLRLLPSQRLSVMQAGRQFLIIPLQLSRVTGNSLHLILFEQTGQSFTQRDDVNLGKDLDLMSLSLDTGNIKATTLGTKTGLALAETKGGMSIFELGNGKFVKLKD